MKLQTLETFIEFTLKVCMRMPRQDLNTKDYASTWRRGKKPYRQKEPTTKRRMKKL